MPDASVLSWKSSFMVAGLIAWCGGWRMGRRMSFGGYKSECVFTTIMKRAAAGVAAWLKRPLYGGCRRSTTIAASSQQCVSKRWCSSSSSSVRGSPYTAQGFASTNTAAISELSQAVSQVRFIMAAMCGGWLTLAVAHACPTMSVCWFMWRPSVTCPAGIVVTVPEFRHQQRNAHCHCCNP